MCIFVKRCVSWAEYIGKYCHAQLHGMDIEPHGVRHARHKQMCSAYASATMDYRLNILPSHIEHIYNEVLIIHTVYGMLSPRYGKR